MPQAISAGRAIGAEQRAAYPHLPPAIDLPKAPPAFVAPRHADDTRAPAPPRPMDLLHSMPPRRVVHGRVVVVDPHQEAVEFVGRTLARGHRIAVTGAFATAHEAVHHVDWISVDVLLIEVDLPGTSGLELMAAALHRNPGLRAVPPDLERIARPFSPGH